MYQLRTPNHSHVEQGNSYTQEGEEISLSEGKRTVSITDQKEKDLQEGGNSRRVVIHLPSSEGEWPVYDEFYQRLQQSSPNINVFEQLNAMRAWLYVNKNKRKSVELLGYFVNNWLRRRANADQNWKQYLQQRSSSSTTLRIADQVIEQYRQSGHKHPIENYIHNMLQQHNER